ncbi:MAG: TolC family protein [Bacteroidota bacterium]|nr:TolC family protein [Bacteroidota bacterium]
MRSLVLFIHLIAASIVLAQETPAVVLTADQAVSIALEKNYGIRLARLEARTSEVLNTPGNAGMLPTLDANGLYSVDNSSTRQVFFSGEVRDADNANSRLLDGALSLNWTVFDGLTMFAAKDRLEALELIGRTELKQQIETTVYEVLNNYYMTVQMRSALRVQEEGLITSRERLSITETGERLGSASGLNLVQARLDLSEDSSALLDLVQQASIAQSQLNILLAQEPSTPLLLSEEIPPSDPLDLIAIQNSSRQNNNSLLQVRQMQALAEVSIKELRGVLFPQVDLFANYGYRRSTSEVGFLQSSRAIGPDYGARVNIPLFRGSQGRSALEVARISREQAALTTEEATLQLEQQIIDGWTTYSTARKRVVMEENNLIGFRQQVDVALESYRLGMFTSVELRDVQQSLIDAENRLLLAQYESKMAELRLKLLAGQL